MTVTPTPAAPSLLPGEDTGSFEMVGVIKLSGPLLTRTNPAELDDHAV